MEDKMKLDPVEVMIKSLVESTAIIAPVFQTQYNGVRGEIREIMSKSGRNMYSRMRKHF